MFFYAYDDCGDDDGGDDDGGDDDGGDDDGGDDDGGNNNYVYKDDDDLPQAACPLYMST